MTSAGHHSSPTGLVNGRDDYLKPLMDSTLLQRYWTVSSLEESDPDIISTPLPFLSSSGGTIRWFLMPPRHSRESDDRTF